MSKIVGCYAIPDTGVSSHPEWVHDHNITVLNGGKLIWFLHLERFTRKKYHAGMPEYLELIAKKLKIIPAKDAVFVFVDHEVGRSFISKSGKIRFEAPLNNIVKEGLEPARLYWFGEWPEAYVLNHELAHIYSCIPFYGNFKPNSLLVHFDGGASHSNFSAWEYQNNKPKLLEAHYKHKWLSSLFNANALVFSIIKAKKKEQNSVPGKFMGLEAFGSYNEEIESWLYKNDFFQNIWGNKGKFYDEVKRHFGIRISDINNKTQVIQDISATIHEVFLKESLKIFQDLKERTKADYLYYSGGTALNIKLNAKLIKTTWFKDIFIPPCTNDSGLALGASIAVCLEKGENPELLSPYLNNYDIEHCSEMEYDQNTIQKLARLIFEGKVIGISNGYGETGPRALGNRSIIARADNLDLAVRISQQIKKREWYRPIAPVMLAENARYFTGVDKLPLISKFMLTEFDVLTEKTKELEGCIHKDNTSRIQVIFSRGDNPFIFDLLHELNSGYNIKALVNTSFNQNGEPIVHTEYDTRKAARIMGLDAYVLNGQLEIL